MRIQVTSMDVKKSPGPLHLIAAPLLRREVQPDKGLGRGDPGALVGEALRAGRAGLNPYCDVIVDGGVVLRNGRVQATGAARSWLDLFARMA